MFTSSLSKPNYRLPTKLSMFDRELKINNLLIATANEITELIDCIVEVFTCKVEPL